MPYRIDPNTGQKIPIQTGMGTGQTTQTTQTGGLAGGNEQLYNALMTLGLGKFGSTTGGRVLQQAQYFKPAEATETEKNRMVAKQNALRIVDQLEENYRTGGLAYGRAKGILETLNAKVGRNPQLNAYMAFRDSVRPMLVKAMGDVGNFSAVEQQWAIANVPTAMNTPEEADLYFRDLRKKMALPERTQIGPQLSTSWQPD